MNVKTLREIKSNPLMRGLLGAALLIANEGGKTVAELSWQLGISKQSIRGYLRKSRSRRVRHPEVYLRYGAIIAGGCDHTEIDLKAGGKVWVCLYCLATNNPGACGGEVRVSRGGSKRVRALRGGLGRGGEIS